jgi:hypothetical protein
MAYGLFDATNWRPFKQARGVDGVGMFWALFVGKSLKYLRCARDTNCFILMINVMELLIDWFALSPRF